MYRNTWSAANVFAVVAAFIKVCFLLLIKTIKQKKTISNQIRIFGQLYSPAETESLFKGGLHPEQITSPSQIWFKAIQIQTKKEMCCALKSLRQWWLLALRPCHTAMTYILHNFSVWKCGLLWYVRDKRNSFAFLCALLVDVSRCQSRLSAKRSSYKLDF